VELLDSPIRKYAWGSHTAIATLQGRAAPTEDPEAELWLGAHPASPSRLAVTGGALSDAIGADPAGILGAAAVERFGPRLPFLLKVLAAAQPLSLQAHPDLEQARAGFAAEEAAGAPAGDRNYIDAWHKPELLVAVGEFDALCGFRDPAESAGVLAALNVESLKATVEALRQLDMSTALRDGVHSLLALSADERAELVREVVAACEPRIGDDPAYALVVELAAAYPGDVGVVVATLLNRVRLTPGEAVYMPAGNLHAYLRGVGVEIMAASDNVLRGGLTPKRVDVDELLRVLRFEVLTEPVRRPEPVAPGLVTWPVPVDDFALHRALVGADVAAVTMPGRGPRVVLCLRGSVRVDDGVAAVALTGGQAAFAPAGRPELAVSGDGEVYQASSRV
jgi:mannose-6-phosphate isomerase